LYRERYTYEAKDKKKSVVFEEKFEYYCCDCECATDCPGFSFLAFIDLVVANTGENGEIIVSDTFFFVEEVVVRQNRSDDDDTEENREKKSF